MLIRFAAENWLSFRERAELSLVAGALRDPEADLIQVDQIDGSLLPAAAIYGSNASGKSNFLAALSFLKMIVLSSHKSGTPSGGFPVRPFAFDPLYEKRASTFEIEFLLEGTRHSYTVSLDKERVITESLTAYPVGRPQVWFRRDGQEFNFGPKLRGENKATSALTRENSLFLSAAATNNHEQLGAVYRYFQTINFGDRRDPSAIEFARWYKSYSNPERVLEILKSADVGICGVALEPIEYTEGMRTFSTELYELLRKNISGDLPPPPPDRADSKVTLRHLGMSDGVRFDFGLESAGTQALIGILPAILDALDSGCVLVLDELVEALHPVLSQNIVALFQTKNTNPKGAQFIFSTHDTNLLNVLRRDQVWFADKSLTGTSKLFPLSDFRTRKEDDIARDYLKGKFGALPFIEHLLVQHERSLDGEA